MGKALLVVIVVVVFVYALFDLIATPADRARHLPKPVWFVVLLLVPIGPLLWLLLGRDRTLPAIRRTKPRPQRPPGPRGPDDDPDYLRNL